MFLGASIYTVQNTREESENSQSETVEKYRVHKSEKHVHFEVCLLLINNKEI